MSIKHLLKKTITDLQGLKGFSFGAGLPQTAEQYGVGDVPAWIPSGLTMLDRALGGGLPLGRISELFSENESEGKTTLALHFAAQVQKVGGVVVWLEAENALDRPRAARLGVDLASAVIFGPPTVEDGFAFIDKMVQNVSTDKDLQGCPVLIVWDTIAASPTKAEKGGDPFSGGMTEKPRIIAQNLRRYVVDFFKYKLHLCLVNQSITNIGEKNPYGPKFVTPGGKAIKFYSTLRIRCKRSGYIGASRSLEAGDQRLGINVAVQAVKNKLALPFREVNLQLFGETGYDDVLSMAEFLLAHKANDAIAMKGGRYYLPNGKCPYWKELREMVIAEPEVLKVWRAKVEELISIPPNRLKNEQGWYVRKEGERVEETEDETDEAPEQA